MKNIFISFVIISLIAGASCKNNTSKSNKSVAKVEYTCSMHPEVVSEKPGKCPKCGMELIQKESDAAGTSDMDLQKDTSMQHKH